MNVLVWHVRGSWLTAFVRATAPERSGLDRFLSECNTLLKEVA